MNSNRRVKVPRPFSGGLILSYRCSAACRHCMYGCSPAWNAEWIAEEMLGNGLAQLAGKIQASQQGAKGVSLNYGLHFTGGEPFLNFDLLLKAVQIAEKLKIPSTFVETNCFWCTSDEVTRERLSLLKASGLRGILISVNPFYAEFIPFERTERCVQISGEVFGRNVMVYQLEYYQLFRRLGIRKQIAPEDSLNIIHTEYGSANVEFFMMGRAVSRLRDLAPAHRAAAFFRQPCRPEFLRSWHNHFDNYGNLLPGYCGGISLGNWLHLDSLTEEGIDLGFHPILSFLISGNMEGLFQFARHFGYREAERGYVSKCDLCLDLRRFLAGRGDFEELAPKEFYEHVE
ncbi:MAG TPA: radical SAM protein [Syntrophobacteria bacterium]|nr:radical SAM protein [Syntrophobacteria bacterium]